MGGHRSSPGVGAVGGGMLYQVVKDAQRGGAVGGGGGGCEHVRKDGEEESVEDGQERRVVHLRINEFITQVFVD